MRSVTYRIKNDELSPERSPWIGARKTFGRIAIANSDATADAMTEGAFEAAALAIKDLVEISRGT
jgi:hypothetical protein